MRAAQLHNHTEFSNLRMLDCIIKTEKLIDRAVEFGMSVAITDHEALSGHVRAIKHVKAGKKSGKIPEDFKLILGNEIYLVDEILEEDGKKYCPTPYYHFILLAKDEIGHRQLRELSSNAWDRAFNTGKMTRIPTLKSDLERVVKENPGHLIASTACIGGELGKSLLEARETGSKNAAEKALSFVLWCREIFGEDFYLEMQPGQSEDQLYVNLQILTLSETYGVETIITCDTHYLKKEDKGVHAAFLNSRSDEERETGDFYDYTYMMGVDEIHELMDQHIGKEEVDRALRNTAVIADKVEEYDLYHPTIVPRSEIPEFEVEHVFQNYYDRCLYIKKFAYSKDVNDRYLLKLIEDGFFEKLPFNTWSKEKLLEYIDRIEVELMEMWLVTDKLGESISSYYLKTLELVNLMWEEGDSIVGPARGSVTGMETMYLIGVIQIDPILWGLPHWRHISHEKVELSDVDIDSQRNRRKDILFAIQSKYTERKVLNSCTFKTEGSKSALLTACRGLGVDNDVAQYLAGMIPITRGITWSLEDCIHGNAEEQKKPQTGFINEIAKYPGVLETAMSIEGLVSGRSIHASALYLFNEDYLEHNAMMRAPNGQPTTQFNMKDSDYMSALKEDMLTVSALDKIRFCMDMLVEAGHMEWQGTLRKTYDKYLHPDVLDYDTQEMWDWVGEGLVSDLFQFDTQVGSQAAKKIKPHSLKELAAANSVMRLMIDKEGAEQPIDTYIRYKNDINQWYDCMRQGYHLTEDEIHTVEPYLKPTYGVGDTQEVVMQLSMDPKISGFNVKQSNLLRKSISKKSKELQLEMKEYFFKHGKEIGNSDNMLNYIWDEVVEKQLGYSFSLNHTIPYSIIGLQELNLAYHYPIIYWNTACLIVNAGADDDSEENKSTQYGKIAAAIANMQKRGINISLPLINSAKFGFVPDEANNRIIYALKAMNNIGDDLAHAIVENQPYASFEDFCERMVDTKIVQKSKMITLIKAGCFIELDNPDRTVTMKKFIKRIVKPIEKLTMVQLPMLVEKGIVPENLKILARIKHFKDYVTHESFFVRNVINEGKKIPKKGYHDRIFVLDEISMEFFNQHFSLDSVVGIQDEFYLISEKAFLKEWEQKVQPLRDWFPSALEQYNAALLKEEYEKVASGSIPKWEMDSLNYYYTEHALTHLDNEKYGVVDFFKLPEEPEAYEYYVRYIQGEKKYIPKNKIVRLAGTVLDNDNNRHMITLLTTTGVVNVKFSKGQYVHYNRQIKVPIEGTDKSQIAEYSWFQRGNNLIVCGYRSEDTFRAYRYKDTIYQHCAMKIEEIREDGSVYLISERGGVNGSD